MIDAVTVIGHLRQIETNAGVTYEHRDGRGLDLAIDRDPRHLSPFRGVDGSFTRSGGERRDVGVPGAVADDDEFDRHSVVTFDVTLDLPQLLSQRAVGVVALGE